MGFFAFGGLGGGGGTTISEYVSPEQTITPAGQLVLAHGLAGPPKSLTGFYKCQVAEFGYSVGDECPAAFFASQNALMSVVIDSTNITIRFNSAAFPVDYIRKDTGGQVVMTTANWKLIVRAYHW